MSNKHENLFSQLENSFNKIINENKINNNIKTSKKRKKRINSLTQISSSQFIIKAKEEIDNKKINNGNRILATSCIILGALIVILVVGSNAGIIKAVMFLGMIIGIMLLVHVLSGMIFKSK